MNAKSVVEERGLVAQREAYRAAWHQKWTESSLDFVLTVPHPFPAIKHGESAKANLMTAGYTCLFNVVKENLFCLLADVGKLIAFFFI